MNEKDVYILLKRKELNLRKWDKILDYYDSYCYHRGIELNPYHDNVKDYSYIDTLYHEFKNVLNNKCHTLILYFIVNDFMLYKIIIANKCYDVLKHLITTSQILILKLIILNSFSDMTITFEQLSHLIQLKPNNKEIHKLIIYLSGKIKFSDS